MGFRNLASFKGILSIGADAVDFFLGSIPGVGTVVDIGILIFSIILWRAPGLIALLEVVPLETFFPGVGTAVEAFIPVCSTAALLAPDKY